MSSLQLGLIAIGAVFILGLLVYNWWQERAIRRDMVRRFDGPIDDVLMGTRAQATEEIESALPEYQEDNLALQEPAFTDSLETPEPEPETEIEPTVESLLEEDAEEPYVAFGEPEEPVELLAEDSFVEEQQPIPDIEKLDEAEEIAAPVAPAEPAAPKPSMPSPALPPGVDGIVDEIALLHLEEGVSGDEARSHINPVADFGKPVRWFGWSVDAWLPLTRDNETRIFSTIVAALQLVDRSGSVQPDGLLGFQEQMENLAAQLGGAVNWAEPRDTMSHAGLLDQFCIEVDVTVTMHVTAGVEGPFAGTKLRGLAEAHGMVLKEDGRFHQLTESGETLYTLASADQRPLTEESLRTSTLHDVVLMMDVPRAPKGSENFRQMAMLGARLENALNAHLTDANRRALGDSELEKIRSQIQGLQAKMLERGITPGGATALRLFS